MSSPTSLPPPQLPPVVGVDWLVEHRDAVVLADVRWYLDGRSGYEAFLAGHLPGAVWVDVDTDLSAPPDPRAGRHPLPEPAAFARALGALGVSAAATVVAYDDAGGGYAARLVWLLRILGQSAALLDGGLAAWTGAPRSRPLATGPVRPVAVDRPVLDWPAERFRTADQVEQAAAGPAVVLDARAPGRFSGAEILPSDIRSGHVPGARNAAWAANLTAAGGFAPAAQLRERYQELGVDQESEVVVYCGSGVTACHDLLTLELLGVTNTALYPGSWSAWSADSSREVATGGAVAR
ncbi:putative 3-mercaptopyruvate sulfurtransferase [Frankia sp. AiPs1]|uniref:sulfurtransferase n=1 Tax=Frankia sp. AiPa1 TaxID=573492 RepID=UPI00202B35D3|nr:sulfurtransferase [Frankia sp. AiPa1]MCL9759335.1 sulfurtransferase [Frankia sp. AiPa1]